ncbi:hypothetical protein [Tortoise microvirus 84]|nr:hypothetical protein [Tortoise microvirus 84]
MAMYNVDTSDGSILPSGYATCVDFTVLFPQALISAVDDLLIGDTMTAHDFVRLAVVEYLLSVRIASGK